MTDTETSVAGFDETDLDMIRRGDMLGHRLGQRVYDALTAADPQPLSASPKGDDLEPVAWRYRPRAGMGWAHSPDAITDPPEGWEVEALVPASRLQSLKAERDALASQVQRMEYSDGDAEHWKFLAEAAEAENATLKGEIVALLNAYGRTVLSALEAKP